MSSSESIAGASGEYDFEGLSAYYLEPMIKSVLDKAIEYNQLLKTTYISSDEVTAIITELDLMWYDLLKETAKFTGFATFPDETTVDNGEIDLVRSYYLDQEVFFKGIVARRLDFRPRNPDALGDTISVENEDEIESIFELQIGVDREGIKPDGKLLKLSGAIDLIDIESLEFDGMMSAERARKILQYFVPEIIDDIDVRLLNPSLEECRMVLKMADLSLDLNSIPKIDAVQSLMINAALERYIVSLFDFDRDVPYLIWVKGKGWSIDEDGIAHAAQVSAGGMVKVERMLWAPDPNEEDEKKIVPSIKLQYLADNKDDDPLYTLVLPVSSIEGFQSLRHAHLIGYDAQE